MSQSTVEDLLGKLGMTPVKFDAETTKPARAAEPTSSAGSKRRNVIIALVSAVVLGTGLKVVGDYTCDRAIDAWGARQQAQFNVADPAALKLFADAEAEALAAGETNSDAAPIGAGE